MTLKTHLDIFVTLKKHFDICVYFHCIISCIIVYLSSTRGASITFVYFKDLDEEVPAVCGTNEIGYVVVLVGLQST